MFFNKPFDYCSSLLRHLGRFCSQHLPYICLLCTQKTKGARNICQDCQDDLPILPKHCPRCANFLPPSALFANETSLCGACLKKPPPFEATYALFPYSPPVSKLITQLKFHHQLKNAQALGEIMALAIQQKWYRDRPLPHLIVPVPLHAARLRERGFNQALEIARPIAKALRVPIEAKRAVRIKPTTAQSGLSADERKKNMRGAFTVHRDYTGISLAVLDDVVTTGHTVSAFCLALKQQGATSIDVWCCARS